jgi:hypothetical protein
MKGAIIERTLNELTAPVEVEADSPFFGVGIGAGTQAGSQMLTGSRSFHLGEGEWFRIVGERSVFVGSQWIAWRLWIAISLLKHGSIAFRKGNGMGLILLSAVAYNLLLGKLWQTTVQGFTIVGIGLTISAMRPRTSITTR